MTSWAVVTRSSDETLRLGHNLGSLLHKGDFIALVGDLGSGKTQFAKGIAAGLKVDGSSAITSPTYTLLNTYNGRLPLYHFDLYRLSGDADIAELGFAEYFYGDGISLVEWADRLQEEMPEELLTVVFRYEGEECRRIAFSATGAHYEELLSELSAMLKTAF